MKRAPRRGPFHVGSGGLPQRNWHLIDRRYSTAKSCLTTIFSPAVMTPVHSPPCPAETKPSTLVLLGVGLPGVDYGHRYCTTGLRPRHSLPETLPRAGFPLSRNSPLPADYRSSPGCDARAGSPKERPIASHVSTETRPTGRYTSLRSRSSLLLAAGR